MGFGQGPFGVTPFGTAPLSFAEEPDVFLNSSDALDGKLKTYTIDEDGNPVPMDDIAQRVLLLTSFALNESPGLIGQDFENKRSDALRVALSPLTKAPASISIELIESVQFQPGNVGTRLVYKNLLTNTKTSVLI